MSNIENKLGRINSLDLLRVISAGIVFLFHIYTWFGIETVSYKINAVIRTGALFMVPFFMLSGFVLFLKYGKTDLLLSENIKSFYVKRIQSIYPNYITFLIIVYAFGLSFPPKPQQAIAILPIEILGLQSLFSKLFGFLGNGGTWFLSVLIILYFLYPFIQHALNLALKHKAIIITLCYILAIYPGIVRAYFGGDFSAYYANPIYRLPEFVIGMFMSSIVLQNKKNRTPLIYLIMLALFYILGIALMYDSLFLNSIKFEQNYIYYNFFAVPLFALVIYCLATTNSRLVTILSCNFIIQYLAKISFSFYLTQTFALRMVKYFIQNNYLGLNPSSYYKITFMALILNIIFSIMMFELIEKTVKRYLFQR